MTSFEHTLPVEPVPKGRPRFGSGHVYTPERTSEFENTVRVLLRHALTRNKLVIPALAGRVGLKLVFWVREERSDLDNYVKAMWDAGNKILYKDDRQIKHCEADLFKIVAGMVPHIELTAWELDPTLPPDPSGSSGKRGSGSRTPKAT